MAARRAPGSVAGVIVPPDDAQLARVYAAAIAAAADLDTAADATVRVFAAAGQDDTERLAATAVRLALRARPAPVFARMALADAEAVALCRLLRLDVGRIAGLLGVASAEVRKRLTRGLASAVPSDATA
jgi:DNA-directed RNA polymerase specialized sigma24 family protein